MPKKNNTAARRVLIENADWILTMDENRTRYHHADLVWEGHAIREIGTNLKSKYESQGLLFSRILDAAGKILLPGFVNAHMHTWQSLIRNFKAIQGLKLEPWLTVMYEIYKDLQSEVALAGAYVSLGDCLKTGCTTSNDLWYPHPAGVSGLVDAEIQAAQELGIRFHPIRSYHSVPSEVVPVEMAETAEQVLADAERLVKLYHDPGEFSMCRVGIGPSIAQYDTEEILRATIDFAEKHDVMVHGHLAESQNEYNYTQEHFGCTPVEWFRQHDLLGRRFYYAHCIHLDERDVQTLAETGTGVVSCPISNMYLSSGSCQVRNLMDAGVERIGLGVDGAASSNSSNMMEEMRVAYLLNRLTHEENPCTAGDILYMATAGGAKALGRQDIGILAPGKAADLALLDWSSLSYAGGRNDPVDCIVLSGDARMVDTVVVNGEIVVEKGRLLRINEAQKSACAEQVSQELLRRASSRIPSLRKELSVWPSGSNLKECCHE